MAGKLINTNLDMMNASKVVNHPNATADGELVNFGQAKAMLQLLKDKGSARSAATGNVNLASPGATHDGVTLALNDPLFLFNQTTQSQNGKYIYNGAAVALTRSPDCDSAVECEAAQIRIEEGTVYGGKTFRQTSVNFTLDTDPMIWVEFGVGASPASESSAGIAEIATQAETDAGINDATFVTPLKLKNAKGVAHAKDPIAFGDGSALQYDITHGKNTYNVHLVVERVSDKQVIDVNWKCLDANTIRILDLVTAPASNAYQACVIAGVDNA